MAGALIRWDLWGAGWRLIFLINLVLGAVAVAGGLRYLPADGPATLRRLDGRGVLIIGAATFALIYPLIQGRERGWPWWTFALVAAGLAGLGWFARHERRSSVPLIEPTLLRRRGYLAGAAVALAFFAATAGIMLVLSFYAQYGLGYSALGAGLMLTPVAAGNVAGALVAMRLAPRLGGRATIQVNLAVALAGLVALACISFLGAQPNGPSGPINLSGPTGPTGLMLAGPVLALGFGLGGTIAPLFATIVAGVTPAETGSASGSLGAIQQLAGSIGVAALATLYAATSHPAASDAATGQAATGHSAAMAWPSPPWPPRPCSVSAPFSPSCCRPRRLHRAQFQVALDVGDRDDDRRQDHAEHGHQQTCTDLADHFCSSCPGPVPIGSSSSGAK